MRKSVRERAPSLRRRLGDPTGLAAILLWLLFGGFGLVECGVAAADGNFTIHGVDPERVRAIRARAERVRKAISSELFGDDAPEVWEEPCAIHVHTSDEAFVDVVGGSPGIARGATSLEFGVDRVTSRRIDLLADRGEIVPDALDHELVHVVLADRFIDSPPPRWADEGLAVLFDSSEKQSLHEEDFREACRAGRAWTCEELLAMEQYPPGDQRQRVFYGQSAALVRWLIARSDTRTFVCFLADCENLGTNAALERHYALPSKGSLAAAWGPVPPAASLLSSADDPR